MVLVPGAEQFAKIVVAAYYFAKKGVLDFGIFVNELKAAKIIDDIATLAPDQKLFLKKAFEEGKSLSKTDDLAADFEKALNSGDFTLIPEKLRLSKIQKIGDKLPINSEGFAGKVFSFDLNHNPLMKQRLLETHNGAALKEKLLLFENLAKKYPEGVKFTSSGFPYFLPYKIKLPNGKNAVQKIQTTGNRSADFTKADELAGITEEMRTLNRWTWHHVEDMETMILVPRDLHDAVRHSGGISVYKKSIDADL
jgi:hypothetical protein